MRIYINLGLDNSLLTFDLAVLKSNPNYTFYDYHDLIDAKAYGMYKPITVAKFYFIHHYFMLKPTSHI